MLIHLEGNIAAGKSTLGALLHEHPAFTFIPEPVEVWQGGFSENMLDRFYAGMPRWSFTFQVTTFFTRVEALAARSADTITVGERCIGTDRHVFAPSLHAVGALDDLEWELYRRFYAVLAPVVPQPDALLYLRTPAAECLRRLQQRHRAEETNVELAYLQQLESSHDAWLLDRPGVIVLDGTRAWTADDVLARINNMPARIDGLAARE
ncbi:MAG: deoxynucleoside kinase [Anaerolineae bacterium]|nr:deoxynucleoside kinase [Anaerolineae bacterium]